VSTVESAKWGKFRGCIPADHLDQVGQINDRRPDRHTGFDFVRFYRNIAFDLAARGY
jgi:triacylglycerol lipase